MIEFFRFDLRYQLRQPLLWITALALMLAAWFSAGSDAFRNDPDLARAGGRALHRTCLIVYDG